MKCYIINGYHHSEKKGYQNGALGVLLLQMVPFSLIIITQRKKGTKTVPLGYYYYKWYVYETVPLGHWGTPKGTILRTVQIVLLGRGTISVPFFLSVWVLVSKVYTHNTSSCNI